MQVNIPCADCLGFVLFVLLFAVGSCLFVGCLVDYDDDYYYIILLILLLLLLLLFVVVVVVVVGPFIVWDVILSPLCVGKRA